MKRSTMVGVLAVVAMAAPVLAGMNTYRFTFTAADLMGYATAQGAEGSVPADVDLYDGASAYGTSYDAGRVNSYWGSHVNSGAFASALTDTSVRLTEFNLWGFDNPQPNQGSNWGDDFRPLNYGPGNTAGATPGGWSSYALTYPWGSPPGDSVCDKLRGWEASGWDAGFNWNDSDLASHTFTLYVTLDTDQVTYGNDTQLDGQLAAPNFADDNSATITFWAGGYMTDAQGNYGSENLWQTNMVLTGSVVPVPGAAVLGVIGLALLRRVRRM
jgi:hypothetical protein